MFKNLLSIVTGSSSTPGNSTSAICQVGPCPCGTYYKKSGNTVRGSTTGSCVGINQ